MTVIPLHEGKLSEPDLAALLAAGDQLAFQGLLAGVAGLNEWADEVVDEIVDDAPQPTAWAAGCRLIAIASDLARRLADAEGSTPLEVLATYKKAR